MDYPNRITQLECHDEFVHAYNNISLNFAKNSYAMKYVKVLTNLD